MIFDLLRRGASIRTSRDLEQFLRAGGSSVSGVNVTPDTAMRHAPVFACIRVLAESVGQLPVHLYEKKGDRRERAEAHPLHRLLHVAPNEYQTSQEFMEMCVAHQALRGNFYAFINRGKVNPSGPPLELLPLNPDAVTPKLLNGSTITYEVRYADGRTDILKSSQVLHIRAFTLDGFRGVTPIAYARNAVGLSMAVDKHAGRLFSNGANPGGLLQTDSILTQDEYDRIKKSWEERHQGAENAHKVAILEHGLKWTQVGLTAEDAQMLESRKFGRTEICGLFRVPPTMIADLERATFSNTEQQARSFVDYTLMPYLTRFENRVRMQLLSEPEQTTHYVKFNVAALVRGDMTARGDFYSKQIQNGALSPNEIRELEDQNPREGGDIYLTPSNMLINGKLPESAAKHAESLTKAASEEIATSVGEAIKKALEKQAAPATVVFERDSNGRVVGASLKELAT